MCTGRITDVIFKFKNQAVTLVGQIGMHSPMPGVPGTGVMVQLQYCGQYCSFWNAALMHGLPSAH